MATANPYLKILDAAGPEDWTGVVSGSLLPITLIPPASGFSGTLRIRTVGGIRLSEVSADPSVSRSPGLSRGPGASYILCVQVAGSGGIRQDGRDVRLQPGQAAIYAAHRASVASFESGFRAVSLHLPAESMDLPLGAIDRLTSTHLDVDPELVLLLGTYLGQLTRSLDDMTAPSRLAAMQAATAMLGSLLRQQHETLAEGGVGGRRRDGLRQRILEFIERNLGDPQLDPTSIARAHFISVRLLHDLFAEHGESVAAYTRRRRLQRCADDLTDPRLRDETVALISWRWGFESASHFGQRFRERYGATPAEFRRLALVGAA